MAYSVLMSVYAKENAAYFSDAVESMLHQSCPPDQFVLVCDGPLTPGLDEAIQRFTASRDGGLFRVLRLPENVGLGRALQAGLPLCDHDLVARMDSDDLALPLRMEHQLALMAADPELAAVGGQIAEFTGAPDNIQGYRIVPTSPEEVRRGAAGRNPMNHMTVLFRREAVLAAGGYQDLKGFEDYFLWGAHAGRRLSFGQPSGGMRAGPGGRASGPPGRPGILPADRAAGARPAGLRPDRHRRLLQKSGGPLLRHGAAARFAAPAGLSAASAPEGAEGTGVGR